MNMFIETGKPPVAAVLPRFFVAGWDGVVMIHYSVAPERLQPQVPFPLELHEGRAWVSLVAFTLRRLRFEVGGPAFPDHAFLNVRTYLPDRGIYFLAEWLNNPLCVLMGPRMYGLPYRYGRIDYRNRPEGGLVRGRVQGRGVALDYEARVPDLPLAPALPGSADEFLMERYTAHTERKGKRRLFRVEHAPWEFVPVDLDLRDVSLPACTGP